MGRHLGGEKKSPGMWHGTMLCRYAAESEHKVHKLPYMPLHGARVTTRARTHTDTRVHAGHRCILTAIKYTVLEGVSYNGFPLFINGRPFTNCCRSLFNVLHPA